MQPTIVSILDELMMLVSESEEYHKHVASADKVHQAFSETLGNIRTTLMETRRRTVAASRRYAVAVVGLTNVGKSTLFNALVGQELAPRRNGPCTAAPIEFEYGDTYQVSAHYFTRVQKPVWPCQDAESVHERLQALADSSGAEQSRTIKQVVVRVPLELLKHGLVLADTPGFGAAQMDGAEGSHEESLKTYLRDSVSQVFWVVLGEQGILKGEKDFHDKFFGQFCDDVIVTGCDDWEPRDEERFRQRFSKVFQNRLPMFHFASGKLGIKARQTGDLEALEAAGIPAIEERIKFLAEPEGRLKGIEESVKNLAQDLRGWYADYCLEDDIRRIKFWRADSFDRWEAAFQDNALHNALTGILTF